MYLFSKSVEFGYKDIFIIYLRQTKHSVRVAQLEQTEVLVTQQYLSEDF